jgi:hypothetical protein
LVAFVLFHRLARRHLDADGANRALLYLALFPAALFLQAEYAESPCRALARGAFLAAERDRWPLAWLLVGLALLTRPTGIALVPPLAVIAWRSSGRRAAAASFVLAPLVFVAYPLVLHEQLGDARAFLHAERFWHRTVSVFGPLDGVWQALHAAWAGVLQLTVGSQTHWYWTPVNPARTATLNLELLAYLVVLVALGVVAWVKIGAPYGVYVAASLAIPLSAPSDLYPLLSLPRFGLAMFPVFLALAAVTRREAIHTAVLSVSAVFLGVAVAGWATWQWVA